MGKRRDPAQIARDRRRIADLYLQGWLQADIAGEVGTSQPTVSRDLKALHKEWLKSALIDFDKAKARELARIDRLEREYWDAWERSKEDAETVTLKGRGTVEGEADEGKPQHREKTMQKKGQVGDPSFLRGVQWCIERRCKILGIDAPDRWEIEPKSKLVIEYVNDWRQNPLAEPAPGPGDSTDTGEAVQLAQRGKALAEDDDGNVDGS